MNKKNGKSPKSPDIMVRDFVSALNKTNKMNDEMIEITKQMTHLSSGLIRSGIPLDTMFHQEVARLSVIFQTSMVECIRAKNDLESAINVIKSLEGRLIKLVATPKRDIILP